MLAWSQAVNQWWICSFARPSLLDHNFSFVLRSRGTGCLRMFLFVSICMLLCFCSVSQNPALLQAMLAQMMQNNPQLLQQLAQAVASSGHPNPQQAIQQIFNDPQMYEKEEKGELA